MECDNNNDFGIASVKALDNKLCPEVCLPGEWQLLNMNLVGDAPLLAPLLSPWDTHLLPCPSCKKAWAVLGRWKPDARRK